MLPQRLKTARIAKGLSQKELARLAHIDQTMISRLESGTRGCSTETLTDIARVLDMTLSELIGDADREKEKAYGSKHPAYKLIKNYKSPEGLRKLALNRDLVNALKITEDEWRTLISIKLPDGVSQDGYVQLLITIRAISPSANRVT